ncbi:N-acetylmuramoyl-L-alanine amidase family protein [Halobacillus massiliensis]|uniref:N-acetylmuramoyl-L-alanine amidase family protein n=1 Tax=Halobacillus massiliensis TaxID=1926286 RepID=UPI0015C42355|nr:N-acetylmuramoyl-L-alanine amidase [Halobacillus massiliensis]
MSNKIFALDAGHGGKDPGATGLGLKEKDVVLEICKQIKGYMDSQYPGIDCRLTRSKDAFTSLGDRTKKANQWKADCFVSVHINSAASSTANGFESFIYTTDDEKSKSHSLQQKLHYPLAKIWTEKGRKDRGKKKANFAVIREFKGASVLLELGFIVNQKDNQLLRRQDFIKSNVTTIGDAVASYFGMSKTKPETPVYRVKVDERQVGAFSKTENVARAVTTAVKSGKSRINVELVK